jgi:hypothetical protein
MLSSQNPPIDMLVDSGERMRRQYFNNFANFAAISTIHVASCVGDLDLLFSSPCAESNYQAFVPGWSASSTLQRPKQFSWILCGRCESAMHLQASSATLCHNADAQVTNISAGTSKHTSALLQCGGASSVLASTYIAYYSPLHERNTASSTRPRCNSKFLFFISSRPCSGSKAHCHDDASSDVAIEGASGLGYIFPPTEPAINQQSSSAAPTAAA